jgi:tRNA dimethylallyltransferase
MMRRGEEMPPKILVIVGPTASGKTRMGVELAQLLNGEVVSADSMQIYRRMDIGTAKPTPEETKGIPHHMIDVAEPWEDYSVARYVSEAVPVVEDIRRRGKLPILVGGTGLYVDSLVSGRSFAVQATGWRETLQQQVKEKGLEPLFRELTRIDPEAAERIGPRDEKRIIRALEVWHESGKTITQHNRETQALPPRYEAVTIGLNFADRKDLHRRIDARVDKMMEEGLVEEIRGLLAAGVPKTCTAMQAIGYKELVAAVETGGDVDVAAEEVKLRSRQYAKRQLTWFRRNKDTHWICWDAQPDFAAGRQSAAKFVEASGL